MKNISNFDNIESCLKEIENRYLSTEKVRKKLADFNDTIQLRFLDSKRDVLFLIKGDQGIEIKDKTRDDNAPVKIEFTSEHVMHDLFNKKLSAIKAYSAGNIKIQEGSIRKLMKLKSLMF